jgi:hypothetical protein
MLNQAVIVNSQVLRGSKSNIASLDHSRDVGTQIPVRPPSPQFQRSHNAVKRSYHSNETYRAPGAGQKRYGETKEWMFSPNHARFLRCATALQRRPLFEAPLECLHLHLAFSSRLRERFPEKSREINCLIRQPGILASQFILVSHEDPKTCKSAGYTGGAAAEGAQDGN